MATASLVIMAAGLGSRFGKGIKQLESIGPNGEIIMDYSIYDAMKAGFDKVVFITRKDLEEDFKKIIGDRISKKVQVEYAFQDINDVPDKFKNLTNDRTKPWGTGHAILACRNVVNEPFVVINADDYYGSEGFAKVYDYLINHNDLGTKYNYVTAGYYLRNTLSDNGTVTRGVINVQDGYMNDINETYEIKQVGDIISGEIENKDKTRTNINLDKDTLVSMNMWGLYPSVFKELENNFDKFLTNVSNNKEEFLLPEVLGNLVNTNLATIEVLRTSDKWFGMTYELDIPTVKDSIRKLIDKGLYEGI